MYVLRRSLGYMTIIVRPCLRWRVIYFLCVTFLNRRRWTKTVKLHLVMSILAYLQPFNLYSTRCVLCIGMINKMWYKQKKYMKNHFSPCGRHVPEELLLAPDVFRLYLCSLWGAESFIVNVCWHLSHPHLHMHAYTRY